MINFDKLADIIKENSSFILTTHVNPDADALGSELALYEILKQKGKKTFIINYSETPYNLGFMDPLGVIETYNPVKHDPVFETADVIAALDFNNPKRVIGMERVFTKSKSLKICIDHHENPSPFAAYYFNDTGYAATGHILYDFIKTTKIIELGFAVAQPLYAAIMTDTGSFRFDR
ncbi:MAG: DHH family phosphoesterase, partial [Syntrophothermus sp.]